MKKLLLGSLIVIFFLGCTTKQLSLEDKVIELRQLLANQNDLNMGNGINIGIEDDNKTINISFENNILFDFNKYDVKVEFQYTLEKISTFLIQNSKFGISIEGHTDSVGDKEYNQKLSEKRALSVASVLIENSVPSERISSIGYGEEFPKYDNDTKEGRDGNRRAEIRLRENIKNFIAHSNTSTRKNKEISQKEKYLKEKIAQQCRYAKPVATGTKFLSGVAGFLQGLKDGDIFGHINANLNVANKTTWIKGVTYTCP